MLLFFKVSWLLNILSKWWRHKSVSDWEGTAPSHLLCCWSITWPYNISFRYTIQYHGSSWTIGLSSVLRPRQHSIGYMGDGFVNSWTKTQHCPIIRNCAEHVQLTIIFFDYNSKAQWHKSNIQIIRFTVTLIDKVCLEIRRQNNFINSWSRSNQ